MTPHAFGMRSVVAAAAAGALVLGSAGAATAAPKAKPSQKLQSISIKGSAPIDLKDVTATTVINVRAKALGTKVPSATVTMTLAVYDKKVGGTKVDGSDSKSFTLDLRDTKPKKVSSFAGAPIVIGDGTNGIWTVEQVGVLAGEITKNGKAYICIASADLSTTDPDVTSKQVAKRLGQSKGKAVRDCVKVVNTAAAPS